MEARRQWSVTMGSIPEGNHYMRSKGSFNRSSSPFKGPPSPAVDKAWSELTDYGAISISEETYEKLNASKNAVKVPSDYGGGRQAFLEVLHQLHCLKWLWWHTYPDYYIEAAENIRNGDEQWHEHMDHCADMLRQKLMCDADVHLLTYNWVEGHDAPHPNFNIPRQCRNFEAVKKYALDHALDGSNLPKGYFMKPKDGILILDSGQYLDRSHVLFLATYQAYFPISYNYELFALGFGGHSVTNDQIAYAQILNTANIFFFWITIYLVKAAFLALYWALFGVSNKFRRAWLCVTAYTVATFLVTFFSIFWSCGTPSKISNLASCNAISPELLVTLEVMWCVLNIVGDILTMALPLGMLREIRISIAQKLGLAGIAGLVIIDIVFDILRTVYTVGDYADSFPNANAVWALLEPTIAVMVCALPTYRSLLSKQKPVPSTTYDTLRGTTTTQKTASQITSDAATLSHEMDNMSAYTSSLRSNRAILNTDSKS
ncbi:hypothetical protein B7494_g4369 [Chlorociboria aeruginascens]|nr:hypothetical protein B7494_g4369 [Chlorociboria aeruginascens]